jgi:hypothetical protein
MKRRTGKTERRGRRSDNASKPIDSINGEKKRNERPWEKRGGLGLIARQNPCSSGGQLGFTNSSPFLQQLINSPNQSNCKYFAPVRPFR